MNTHLIYALVTMGYSLAILWVGIRIGRLENIQEEFRQIARQEIKKREREKKRDKRKNGGTVISIQDSSVHNNMPHDGTA